MMNVSSISSLTSSLIGTSKPAATDAGQSFGAMLANLGGQTINSIKESEATAMAALQGKASVQEVVMKTLAAEEQLQAAIAVRDKLLSALNDITHMQI
jgi:flagellar hook-basal body complex protein FliE